MSTMTVVLFLSALIGALSVPLWDLFRRIRRRKRIRPMRVLLILALTTICMVLGLVLLERFQTAVIVALVVIMVLLAAIVLADDLWRARLQPPKSWRG
jgi:uncharacterized membrane protein YfcA